jgi:hypothetical protein
MLHWHGKIETSQQADPVEKSSNYFSKWYVKNKPRLAAKRRTLYETNKSYREKAIARASAFRAAKREVPPAGYVVTLGMAANALGVVPETLRAWGKRGYYPEPLKYPCRFWFTENQLKLLVKLGVLLCNGGRRNQGALKKMTAWINDNWL